MAEVGRFAPSTTGPAHPGTLLAALLCWLDARSRGARLVLRLEDLDPERSRPEWSAGDPGRPRLAGPRLRPRGGAARRRGAPRRGALAPRRCGPALPVPLQPRRAARPRRDARRTAPRATRARVGAARFPPAAGARARSRCACASTPGRSRPARRAGSICARIPSASSAIPWCAAGTAPSPTTSRPSSTTRARGVTRVVRGRDLAASTAAQLALRRLLGLAEPRPSPPPAAARGARREAREAPRRGGRRRAARPLRAAGAVRLPAPARRGSPEQERPVSPAELLPGFSWQRVAGTDRVVRWAPPRLLLIGSAP